MYIVLVHRLPSVLSVDWTQPWSNPRAQKWSRRDVTTKGQLGFCHSSIAKRNHPEFKIQVMPNILSSKELLMHFVPHCCENQKKKEKAKLPRQTDGQSEVSCFPRMPCGWMWFQGQQWWDMFNSQMTRGILNSVTTCLQHCLVFPYLRTQNCFISMMSRWDKCNLAVQIVNIHFRYSIHGVCGSGNSHITAWTDSFQLWTQLGREDKSLLKRT